KHVTYHREELSRLADPWCHVASSELMVERFCSWAHQNIGRSFGGTGNSASSGGNVATTRQDGGGSDDIVSGVVGMQLARLSQRVQRRLQGMRVHAGEAAIEFQSLLQYMETEDQDSEVAAAPSAFKRMRRMLMLGNDRSMHTKGAFAETDSLSRSLSLSLSNGRKDLAALSWQAPMVEAELVFTDTTLLDDHEYTAYQQECVDTTNLLDTTVHAAGDDDENSRDASAS
ncbi:unnamed protein product, partial [Amoebophrya sp. A25]